MSFNQPGFTKDYAVDDAGGETNGLYAAVTTNDSYEGGDATDYLTDDFSDGSGVYDESEDPNAYMNQSGYSPYDPATDPDLGNGPSAGAQIGTGYTPPGAAYPASAPSGSSGSGSFNIMDPSSWIRTAQQANTAINQARIQNAQVNAQLTPKPTLAQQLGQMSQTTQLALLAMVGLIVYKLAK